MFTHHSSFTVRISVDGRGPRASFCAPANAISAHMQATNDSESIGFLLHIQPEQFDIDDLAALRCVCATVKQHVCEAVLCLHAAQRSKILEVAAAFPTVEHVRLVEIDFRTWAAHCTERLAQRAAAHIDWLADEGRVSVAAAMLKDPALSGVPNTAVCKSEFLSRLLGMRPLEMGTAEAAAMRAMDRIQLICRLEAMWRSGQDVIGLYGAFLPASLLNWGQDAILLDGRRGIFHASLDSIVSWRAAQGRTIDRGAAFMYLRWFTRAFVIGSYPKSMPYALHAHKELLAMRHFMYGATRAESEDGLIRSLRQQFGAERTATMQNALRFSVRVVPAQVAEALAALFEEMVRDIATPDLAAAKRGILKRKWTAVLSIGGQCRGPFERVQKMVDALI